MVPTLVLLGCLSSLAQTAPPGWKTIRDAKGACQIVVPPEWAPLSETGGAAVYHDASTAIAVVTSQPGQPFKPLPDSMLKIMNIPKEKLFENSAKRIFYQDKSSRNQDDPNSFSSSVPAKGGTCSCRVVILPSIAEEIVRKIVLSLSAAPEESQPI